ncbi:hypothetical protein HaLaN_02497 [Haematococcus lacustris]|uniref:Uncharacterized protein n=1 Tax=Haematococcus lacustris TaxID=44745 RepID=A0A699YE88_HAELA|nr:hypothetical protein HaLaN_02497 [Haematococcus lacustris]
MGQFGSHRPPQDIAFAPARSIAQAVDALQNHVTVQSSATGAGGASLVLVCPGRHAKVQAPQPGQMRALLQVHLPQRHQGVLCMGSCGCAPGGGWDGGGMAIAS